MLQDIQARKWDTKAFQEAILISMPAAAHLTGFALFI
jgi:hypothetical protein